MALPAGPRKSAAPDSVAPLGEALGRFLARSGFSAALKHPEIHAVWREIVGPELASRTRIASLRRGVLEVEVESSSLMSDMAFHRAALLSDLQAKIRKPFIRAISFVLGPGADRDVER